MGNGANKLFNIMNKTGNQNNSTSLVTLTVKSTNPLIFKLDEKLSITEEFYILDNPEGTFEINDAVNALVLNNNQLYYILNGLDLAEIAFSGDYNDLTNKPSKSSILAWQLIAEHSSTNTTTIDLDDIELYDEFLLTVSDSTNPAKVLTSNVIPKDVFAGMSHQAVYYTPDNLYTTVISYISQVGKLSITCRS